MHGLGCRRTTRWEPTQAKPLGFQEPSRLPMLHKHGQPRDHGDRVTNNPCRYRSAPIYEVEHTTMNRTYFTSTADYLRERPIRCQRAIAEVCYQSAFVLSIQVYLMKPRMSAALAAVEHVWQESAILPKVETLGFPRANFEI